MKRKKIIFGITGVGVIALVGATFAVSQNTTILNNLFGVGKFETSFYEEFESPSNWSTCEKIDKVFTITNNSNVPAAVRVSLEEQWIAADGTTELPLISSASNLQMVQINMNNNSGWTQSEGGKYYYYDVDLGANESTQALLTGVTLNCDANLDTTGDSDYADATYHLKIKGEAIQADQKMAWHHEVDCNSNLLYDKVACQTNGLDTNVNFTTKATVAVGNGNGVNTFRAKADEQYPVYYYRGEVSDNNVVWANKCWKIVRTTETGGTKMVYNGVPTENNGVKQCLATGTGSQITVDINGVNKNTFAFNSPYNSPADVGYMYGERATASSMGGYVGTFVFSNNVSRNGNTYTLDTSAGQSISGGWGDKRAEAAVRYHYFCTDGATSCDDTKIGYIIDFDDVMNIAYLKIGGYDNIEALKAAMYMNTNDSNAKAVTEAWFEQQNLDGHLADTYNYEDDLEDTIFCNDRSYYFGSLKGKDSDATPNGSLRFIIHSANGRNAFLNANNNYSPSFDCDKNDSFTRIESASGNGKLNHKVGLITADELTLAGVGSTAYDSSSYLNSGQYTWSMSPNRVFISNVTEYDWNFDLNGDGFAQMEFGIRPMVSLKAGTTFANNGADGTKQNPYMVGQ